MLRIILLLALCSIVLPAQPAGTISGFVKDPQGRRLPDAQLRLYRQDTKSALTTNASSTGSFQFDRLEPGGYLLETQREGFQTTTKMIEVAGNNPRRIEVTLPLSGVNQSVVVTAVDQAQTMDEVSKAFSAIAHDEIINRNTYSLTDILSTTPGLQIRNQGGPGQFTSMSVRGLPSSAAAVLVDGLRFRDASTTQGDATSFLSNLNFINADRVEVLRGSGSSLYGTNAVGGAVNVVSDQGGGPTHGDIQVEGGTLGFFRTRGNIAGGTFRDKLKYSAGILHLNVMSGVDGQDANRSSGVQGFLRYDLAPKFSLTGRFWGSDDFAQINNSPTSSGIPGLGFASTSSVSAIPLSPAGVQALLSGGSPNYGNANYLPNLNDPDSRRSSRMENAAFIFRNLVTPKFNWQASYQIVHTGRIYRNGPVGLGFQPEGASYSGFAGTIHTAGLRATAQVTSWWAVTGGYEFERENYFDRQDNNLAGAQRLIANTRIHQNSNSGYFSSQVSLLDRRLHIAFSGRAQNYRLATPNFQYAGTENPYVGIAVNPPKALTGDISIAYLIARTGTKLRAHVGNSYRAPALYERFGAGLYNDFFTGQVVFTPYGDPRLSPDRYNSFDVGIDQYVLRNKLRVSGTFFYTRIVQLINFNSNGVVNPGTDPFGRSSGYLNGAGGISRGAELSVETHPISSLTISGSYTYVNVNNDQDRQVPGFFGAFVTPRHSVTFVATKDWKRRFTTTFNLFRYSSYFDPSVGYLQAYRFPGYGKSDLIASYKIWNGEQKSMSLYAKVDNVFNQRNYVSGFLSPRATFLTGLRYSF